MLRWDWNNWWRHVLNYYTTFSYKSLYLISILGTRTASWSNTSTARGKINRFRAHSCHRRNLSSLAAETSSSSLKITGSGRAEKIPCTSPKGHDLGLRVRIIQKRNCWVDLKILSWKVSFCGFKESQERILLLDHFCSHWSIKLPMKFFAPIMRYNKFSLAESRCISNMFRLLWFFIP